MTPEPRRRARRERPGSRRGQRPVPARRRARRGPALALQPVSPRLKRCQSALFIGVSKLRTPPAHTECRLRRPPRRRTPNREATSKWFRAGWSTRPRRISAGNFGGLAECSRDRSGGGIAVRWKGSPRAWEAPQDPLGPTPWSRHPQGLNVVERAWWGLWETEGSQGTREGEGAGPRSLERPGWHAQDRRPSRTKAARRRPQGMASRQVSGCLSPPAGLGGGLQRRLGRLRHVDLHQAATSWLFQICGTLWV